MGELALAKFKIVCKIGELLEKEGRSQTWLANQIGATKQQVYSWCQQNGPVPNIGYIMRIMKATGWILEDMFEEE